MWMHVHGHGHRLVGQVYDHLENIQPGLARKVVGGVVAGAAVSYLAVRGYRYCRSRRIARERGMAARQACQNLRDYLKQKEQEEGPMSKEKNARIVSLTLTELREKLKKGELKAVEVLRAYQRKALQVTDRTNCVTEPIMEAEAMAMQLDLLQPDQRGPLHGIPVSIKDSAFVQGYDCHGGLTFFANKPVEKDADIVKLLKDLGAVPFVRTNFPQGLMRMSCSNPMYGRTCNPHNVHRTPGGSSGGEGALIAGGGSVIGIGSDLGGSIRIPSQMCGVYGLKPTVDRIVNKGEIPIGVGETLVRPTLGPMARDMEGLIQLSRELFTPRMHSLDPTVPPLFFRDELFEKKGPLRIGFYTAVEKVSQHPACVRAVMEAKAALEQKGHKVIQFNPPRAYEAFCELFMKACFGDDGEDVDKFFKDDVVDESVRFLYYMGKLPLRMRLVINKLLGFFDPLLGQLTVATCRIPRTVVGWWHLEEKIQAYKEEFLDAWKRQKLDAVICPGLPFPALTLGTEDYVWPGIVYTALYNLLNYPAGMMPVSTVTQQDVQRLKDPAVYPRSGPFEKFVVKDAEGSVGLPVPVQCVALPYQEEMVLRVMKDIHSVIRQ